MLRTILPVVALLLPHELSGQATGRPEVRGRVVSGDRPVAGGAVEILLREVVLQQAVTDAQGTFRFPGLMPGAYDLVARQLGYRRATVRGIGVVAGQTESVTVTMEEVPVVLHSVAVVGRPGITIDRQTTEMGTEVRRQQIELLPNSHEPKDLVGITPGARPGHVWAGSTFQANNYQVDGLAANHPGVGGDFLQPSINWIERVEVRGLGAGAEHGNFRGGLINLVTKAGTNDFQGAFRTNFESQRIGTEVRW